jgi:DNA (cytosine-5)-methyltransferase 1
MHLFAGVGGGLLADLILGHKPIIAVEWDKYACKILRERVADGWFPDLSVWEGDVRLFDPFEYEGRVDCIHAGFPCQDISVAGNQAGLGEGTRSGLYREVLRIAGVVRPRYIFLENVSAILSNGLGTVLGDLAAMGYDCKWLCIKASDVGAPHGRDRWFALAENVGHSSCEFSNGINDNAGLGMERGEVPKSGNSSGKANVAHANSTQCKGNQCSERVEQKYSNFGSSSWWTTEPDVGRVADGISDRVGKLKGLGNAQVPIQAAAAWRLFTLGKENVSVEMGKEGEWLFKLNEKGLGAGKKLSEENT